MRTLIVILIGIIFFITCCSTSNGSVHGRLIEHLMSKFVLQAEKKYQVRCFGSGGAFMDKINEVRFSFTVIGPKSKSDMRKLIVDIADDFLQVINADVKIREHLINYPFTEKNLCFTITIVEKNNQSKTILNKGSSKDLLSYLYLGNGKLSYAIENEEKVCYQKVYEESYEEAYGIVRGLHAD